MKHLQPSKRILIAVLNWGLGHAARSVPLVEALRERGHEIFIASDGDALKFLKEECKDENFLDFPSYHPYYPADGSMILTMGRQLPKFLSIKEKEQRLTEEFVHKHQIDGIISDSRWGCYSHSIPSVMVTHQVNLQVPGWASLASGLINKINHKVIANFDECWVPDNPNTPNLSGQLSSQNSNVLPICYIGPLSRLSANNYKSGNGKWDVLVLLSGPEPQRSILEEKLTKQLSNTDLDTLMIRGLPNSSDQHRTKGRIRIVNTMTSSKLADAFRSARIIIGRPGYSTLMDLAATGKQGLLIPTPGQTEQEYLAKRMQAKRLFYTVTQEQLDISKDLPQACHYNGLFLGENRTLLNRSISRFLKKL